MTHRCPDEETLAAYFDGLMPAEDEAILQAEMIQCPDCTRLVAALGLVIEAEEPDAWRSASVPAAITQAAMDLWPAEPNPVTEGLRVAARWLGEALQPLADALAPMQLAGGLVRGAAAIAEEELRYTVNVGDIPLQLDLEVDGPRQIALSVRPLEAPPPGPPPPRPRRRRDPRPLHPHRRGHHGRGPPGRHLHAEPGEGRRPARHPRALPRERLSFRFA